MLKYITGPSIPLIIFTNVERTHNGFCLGCNVINTRNKIIVSFKLFNYYSSIKLLFLSNYLKSISLMCYFYEKFLIHRIIIDESKISHKNQVWQKYSKLLYDEFLIHRIIICHTGKIQSMESMANYYMYQVWQIII